MQPAKLYMERVLREAGTLGNSQSAQATGLSLTRSALRLAAQVCQQLPAFEGMQHCLDMRCRGKNSHH